MHKLICHSHPNKTIKCGFVGIGQLKLVESIQLGTIGYCITHTNMNVHTDMHTHYIHNFFLL